MARRRLEEVGEDPDYRYSLANERTFLSWIRTSLALMAGGVAVVQLAPDLGPRPLRVAVGALLIVIAGLIGGASYHRWVVRERAMRLSAPLPSSKLTVLLGYGLAVIAVVVLVVVVTAGGPE